jgi:hypothetical protein
MIPLVIFWNTVITYTLLTPVKLLTLLFVFLAGSAKSETAGSIQDHTISGAIHFHRYSMASFDILSDDGFEPNHEGDTDDQRTIGCSDHFDVDGYLDTLQHDIEPVASNWSVVPGNSSASCSRLPTQLHMTGIPGDSAIDNAVHAGMRSNLPKFPWEMNLMARVFGKSNSDVLSSFQLPNPTVFAGYQVQVGYEPLKPVDKPVAIIPFAVRRLRLASQIQSEDTIRDLAITKWRLVIESDIDNCEVGRQIQAYCETFKAEQNILAVLNDVFSKKSTATLYKRVQCFLALRKMVFEVH